MRQAEGTEEPVKVEFDNFEHGFPAGFGPGGWGYLAYAIGIVFAAFQLYVAAFNYLPSQVVRGVHVGFLSGNTCCGRIELTAHHRIPADWHL